ncbi:MAG TPA: ATP-binding protein, partial [Pararobbsia sp.]|nr:ATP-binding protein [Pararobbsia sp.]
MFFQRVNASYRCTRLAVDVARQLCRPEPLEQTYQSGLFIVGPRRIGKTAFLKLHLIPALEAERAVVIYVNLLSQARANPEDLVVAEIRQTLADLSTPHSALLDRLRAIHLPEACPEGFKFRFEVDQLGEPEGATLAQAIT